MVKKYPHLMSREDFDYFTKLEMAEVLSSLFTMAYGDSPDKSLREFMVEELRIINLNF